MSKLSKEEIQKQKDEIISKYGAWTDHNIKLSDGIYTIGEDVSSEKLRRIVQIVSDMAKKPVGDLRLMDLACLEGQYAIEFASQGADVVAIEGREPNIEKSKFSQRMLNLDNLEFRQGDVRDLDKDDHGMFDVVLCLGILYHIDAPDVFDFLKRIGSVCSNIAVFDTYCSLDPKQSYSFDGKEYFGRDIVEHTERETEEDKEKKLWSSLDNSKSVWITKATLINFLTRQGFTSVYECHVPVEHRKPTDRVTIVAIKGQPAEVVSSPRVTTGAELFPEHRTDRPSHHQRPMAVASKTVLSAIPRAPKEMVKSVLRSVGLMKARQEQSGNPAFKWFTEHR